MIETSLTEAEASRYLTAAGLPTQAQTLRAWRYRGRGPAYLHPEGKIRYRESDLNAFLENSRVVPQRQALPKGKQNAIPTPCKKKTPKLLKDSAHALAKR